MAPVSFHPAPLGTREWGFPAGRATIAPPTISSSGSTLSMTTVGKTDWWRTTSEWRSSGASYLFSLTDKETNVLDKDSKEELRFAVRLGGDWEVQSFFGSRRGKSDQAALFLYFSDQLWLKTGIEFTEGKAWVSVVVTNRWSDWSLRPIPLDADGPLRFEIRIQGHHLKVYLGDEMMREVNGFAQDITPEEKKAMTVGVMGCSPIGEGTTVQFADFELEVGPEKKSH